MRTIPLALGAVLLLSGCDHNPLEATLAGNAELAPPGRAVLVTQIGTGLPADPIEITGAAVSNDTLSLTVRYIGGCVAHGFGFVVSTNFTIANPVEASSLLTHSAAGESCQVPVGGTVRFDVTPVRDHYRTTFGVLAGEILFRIEPGDRTARYLF
jgi:hypothetical protein